MKKYFANINTAEELKKAYKEYCLNLHPDKGGNAADFIAMRAEYKTAAERIARKEVRAQEYRRTNDSDQAGAERQRTFEEILKEFTALADVVADLAGLEGITLEICGSWLWITGQTFLQKDAIKAAGCFYSSKKKAWYWKPFDGFFKKRGNLSLNEIRDKYGSIKVDTNIYRLAACH